MHRFAYGGLFSLALLFLTVGVPAFTLSTQSAYAQSCYNYDATIAELKASPAVASGEMTITEVKPEDLAGFIVGLNEVTGLALEGVTRAFVFLGPKVLVGVEVNGCLLDPIEIVMPLNFSMSGKLPDGRTAA